ncbi:hypothetical protein M8J76_003992 [Diaphorina citri]|nr:hypothetical protein M8J75_013223 [Diaphorina citri]KAI5722123.1 hypothetical protein M8J76_003992 [Diaphorina citri]
MLTSKSVLCFGILFISFAFVLSREYEATTSSSIVERVENSARDVYEKVKVPLQKIEEGRDKLASSLDHIRRMANDKIRKILEPATNLYEEAHRKFDDFKAQYLYWFNQMSARSEENDV